jgi:4-hydroxybenzoate polyprenyltransferase
MKKVEIILVALSIVGLCLSILLIVGGNFSTVIGLSLLSMIYFVFGFALFNGIGTREIFKKSGSLKTLRILGGIATGMAMSVGLTGILFTALSWSGSSMMLLIGVIVLSALSITAAIKYSTNKDSFYRNILLRIVPTAIVALVFLFFGDQIFYDFKYRNYPEFLDAYHQAKADPGNETLWMKVEVERRRITQEG